MLNSAEISFCSLVFKITKLIWTREKAALMKLFSQNFEKNMIIVPISYIKKNTSVSCVGQIYDMHITDL